MHPFRAKEGFGIWNDGAIAGIHRGHFGFCHIGIGIIASIERKWTTAK